MGEGENALDYQVCVIPWFVALFLVSGYVAFDVVMSQGLVGLF